jgi:membrane protease YdiL (CAAX protease family)
MQRSANAEIAKWIVVSLGLVATAWMGAQVTGLPAIPLVTAAPAVAALVVSGSSGAMGALGFTRLDAGSLPVAVFGPLVVQMAGLLLLVGLGLVTWKAAPFAGPGLAGKAALLLGSAVFVAMMEEIAFRGFLMPRLLQFGVVKAVLLSGLAHGVWRLPLMISIGMPMAAHAATAVPLVVLTFTLGGAFHGLLRLIGGSIWPPVLAHTMAIIGWAATTGLTTANVPWAFEYSAAIMIFGLLNLNVLAVLMLRPDDAAGLRGAA